MSRHLSDQFTVYFHPDMLKLIAATTFQELDCGSASNLSTKVQLFTGSRRAKFRRSGRSERSDGGLDKPQRDVAGAMEQRHHRHFQPDVRLGKLELRSNFNQHWCCKSIIRNDVSFRRFFMKHKQPPSLSQIKEATLMLSAPTAQAPRHCHSLSQGQLSGLGPGSQSAEADLRQRHRARYGGPGQRSHPPDASSARRV